MTRNLDWTFALEIHTGLFWLPGSDHEEKEGNIKTTIKFYLSCLTQTYSSQSEKTVTKDDGTHYTRITQTSIYFQSALGYFQMDVSSDIHDVVGWPNRWHQHKHSGDTR